MNRLLLLVSLLAVSGWARDLHEARVVLVEKELPADKRGGVIVDRRDDGVIVSRSVEEERLFPAYLPLELHADGDRVTFLMLQRSADLDEGFPIESADGDFETIPAQRMTDAAMYQDLTSRAAFGVKRDASGNREYEGSFEVDGQTYFLSRENDNKRSEGQYELTRLERKALSSDALEVSDEQLERMNPKFDTRATNFKVAIGVLVDHTEYKFWNDKEKNQKKALDKINYKMTYMLNAMRMAYKTVTGSTITPYFVKLTVNTDPSKSLIDDPYNQYTNSANLYLERWAEKAPEYKMKAGTDVDVGMWWAKYDICGDKDCGVIGLAWLNAVCNPTHGYNIIEDTGFDTWQTAAHELAHNLGSEHDGDGNDCDPEAHFVMSPGAGWPGPGYSNTGYDFSSCSSRQMRSNLASKQCVRDDAKDGFTKVNGGLPGAYFTVDDQCEMLFGSGSSECTWVPASADRCSAAHGVTCTAPDDPKACMSMNVAAWEGTPCGGGKHCFNRKCVN